MVRAPGAEPPPGSEGIVEDVAGPNEDGTGWAVTLRLADAGAGDSLVLLSEADLEPTGLAEDEHGERMILEQRPPPEERRDCIELRLFTEITDGIEPARLAERIERELVELLGGAGVSIEARAALVGSRTTTSSR